MRIRHLPLKHPRSPRKPQNGGDAAKLRGCDRRGTPGCADGFRLTTTGPAGAFRSARRAPTKPRQFFCPPGKTRARFTKLEFLILNQKQRAPVDLKIAM